MPNQPCRKNCQKLDHKCLPCLIETYLLIKIYTLIKMQRASQKVDVTSCKKEDPPHPCDSPVPCDPFKEDEGNCPDPFLCLERVKNPASSGEITRYKPGRFMNVKTCAKEDPPHPCDPPPPCSKIKKPPCNDPPLCIHRIKNPEEKKEDDNSDCDPSN
ncbi:hypothetical protein K1T71_013234 [Dendrolimus kikuchii]|uniref:Uncharacterized protein n=1 Tax=Dendrolimus kikuchii TaxID=765133 RepID=A0ACC1CHG2_9NEOP|nr:hypothetical protein K1T71_013234 [Dendrolimus kikuchii]